MRALADEPAQRFSSASELAKALDGCLDRSAGSRRARWLLATVGAAGAAVVWFVAHHRPPPPLPSGSDTTRTEVEPAERLVQARRLALGSASRPGDAVAARRLLDELEERGAPVSSLRLALVWAHVSPRGLGRSLRLLRGDSEPDLRGRLRELSQDDPTASVLHAIALCEGYGTRADPQEGKKQLAFLAREADEPTRALAIRWLRHAAAVGDTLARSHLRRLGEGATLPLGEVLDPRDLLGFDRSTSVPVPATIDALAGAKRKHEEALQSTDLEERARRLLGLAEELGYAGSHVELGQLWAFGLQPDLPLALRHYASAAIDAAELDAYGCPRGYAWAWLRLGWAYLFGIGCEVDPREAHRCLREAEARLPERVGPRIHRFEVRLWTSLARLSGRGVAADRAAGMSELERVLAELEPYELEELGYRLRLAADREAWSAWLFARVAKVLGEEERASYLVRAEGEGVDPAVAAIASWSRGDPAREAIVERLRSTRKR